MTQLFGIDLALFDSPNFVIEENFHQQFYHHLRQGMASFHKTYMWFQQNLQDVLFDLVFTNCSETFQVPRSEYEIALSQEWEGQFTWNGSDTSRHSWPWHQFCLTIVVGWVDVPDSDRVDFRRQHAINISSFTLHRCPPVANRLMFIYIHIT